MQLDSHAVALTNKHAEIEKALAEEEHRPAPDSIRIMELKKEKLRVKEELEKYTHH
ncbi:MAG: hypothetical protein CMF31_03395 [Kordiimonas sp.]|nr:hypothetical protein [Kordiimonas sp.]|tara:strand:+ start:1711 stop:1878 length:168 start_codon:yes stop_codon:yes gene_type:complete